LTALEKIREQVPGSTIDVTPTNDPAFKKLEAGRVQAVFCNKDVGLAFIQRYGLTVIHDAGRVIQLSYLVGFSRTVVP
jgi:polar amino acid transport system substrate-binding protein